MSCVPSKTKAIIRRKEEQTTKCKRCIKSNVKIAAYYICL